MECQAGYAQRLLEVNLSNGEIRKTPLDEAQMRDFLGGAGLAARLFLDRFSPRVDPLSDENPLFVMTGPLVGTLFPGSSRFAVCARSPLTGYWGVGTCGGNLGPELKFAGYDGIQVEGRADKPVYLLIEDEKVEVRDAGDLWGKDIYEVTKILKERHSDKRKAKVLAIGQAGENQVRFAAIGNDNAHFIGRTGMGAVMGSKQLKAIVVQGTGKVLPALPDEYKEIRERVLEKCKTSMIAQSMKSMGTAAAMDLGMMTGDVPIRNWTRGEFEGSSNIGGPAMTAEYLTRGHACFACPIACKRVVKVEEGPYQTPEGPGPEYETLCTFGSYIENENLEAIIKANELCNRYGLDTISCGATIAFAMECYEKGIITSKETDGVELRWGDINAALKMVDGIALRRGIGDLLAEGSLEAAKKLGKDAEDLVVAVKGLEVPAHDPRGFHGMGLEYAVGYRGACHLQHLSLYIEQGMSPFVEAGLRSDYPGPESEGKAEMAFLSQNLGVPAGSVCICVFVYACLEAKDVADMIHSVTGWDYSMKDLLAAGERLWLLQRGMTNLMGARAADDRLPGHILTPLNEGMAAGSAPDMQRMIKEFYKIRGLDANGLPRKDVLDKHGLSDLAEKLHTNG